MVAILYVGIFTMVTVLQWIPNVPNGGAYSCHPIFLHTLSGVQPMHEDWIIKLINCLGYHDPPNGLFEVNTLWRVVPNGILIGQIDSVSKKEIQWKSLSPLCWMCTRLPSNTSPFQNIKYFSWGHLPQGNFLTRNIGVSLALDNLDWMYAQHFTNHLWYMQEERLEGAEIGLINSDNLCGTWCFSLSVAWWTWNIIILILN